MTASSVCEGVCLSMFTARISRHQLIDSSEERSKCAQSIADRLKQLQNDHQVGAVRDSMFSTFMRLLSELEGWSKTDAATELSSEAEAEQSSAKQSERIYVVQSLLLCLQVAEELVHCQCLAFGDLLDLYTELLDECTLTDSIYLCDFFLSRRSSIRRLLESQSFPNGQHVARARLLGMANAFQRKLEGAPGSTTVLARFRLCVVDLMPKCFHGLCNRGTRDLPPQHFQLPTAIGDVELWGPPELSDTEQSKDDGGSASDSSSGSVRNFQQSGDKRRRTAGAVDVSGGVGDVSPTIRRKQSKGKGVRQIKDLKQLERDIYSDFWTALNLVQDPVTVLSSLTIGEALRLIRVLSDIILLFKLHPTEPKLPTPNSELPTPGSLDQAIETHHMRFFKSSVFGGHESSLFSFDSSELPTLHDPIPSYQDPIDTQDSSNQTPAPTAAQTASALSLLISRGSSNSRPTFSAFSSALRDDSFRRCLLHQFSAFLRGLKIKSKKSLPSSVTTTTTAEATAVFDTLSAELRSAIKSFSDSLYRLMKRLPAVPSPDPPSLSHSGLPWFLSSSGNWSPIATLAALAGEFDAQEVMMGRWKREGCTDPKLPSWRKLSSESDVILSTERTELVPQILMQTVPPAAGFSIKKPKSSALDQSLLARWKVYSTYFLPVLGSGTSPTSDEGRELDGSVRVVGGSLPPPSFSRERVDWYLPAQTNTVPLSEATVGEKLFEKFEDHKLKVMSDDDPKNEIEEDEKIVKDPLFQWRCHRLLNLTNLKLYDHSNQDKELRSKIREASVEDLIQVVIKRSVPVVVPTPTINHLDFEN